MTVNTDLLDKAVSHQIGLHRLASGTTSQVVSILDRYDDSILNALAKREAESGSLLRVDAALNEIRKLNDAAYREVGSFLRKELFDLAKYERDYQLKSIGSILPMDWPMKLVLGRDLTGIVEGEAFNGGLLSEWVKGMADGRYNRIRQAIRTGATEGETVGDIIDRIAGLKQNNFRDGVLAISRRSADSVTRMASAHVTSGVRDAIALNNDDLIGEVMWVSVLDERTTAICRSRDGNIYPVDQGPRPPAHFNCRSTIVAIVRSWRDIGFEPTDLSPEDRAVLAGEVPRPPTYQMWLKAQPPEFQNDVLGSRRAQLFRDGKLQVSKFRDYSGKRYTLQQLRVLEAPAVKRPFNRKTDVTPRKKFGWKPDLPDRRDLLYGVEEQRDIALPVRVSLRDQMPPIVNQGDLGACTAAALVSVVMYTLGPKTPMLSRLDLYYDERVIENTVKDDDGAEIRDGIKALAKWGVCTEETWPYKVRKFRLKPPPAADEEAKTYRITSYFRLKGHDDFMKCLASGFPFVGGFTAYDNFDDEEIAKSGIMLMPTIDQKTVGGHAIAVVGYDTKFHANPVFLRSGLSSSQVPDLMYECRNSFGVEWGDRGHFWMPAAYLEDRDLSDDFWTIRLTGAKQAVGGQAPLVAFNPWHEPAGAISAEGEPAGGRFAEGPDEVEPELPLDINAPDQERAQQIIDEMKKQTGFTGHVVYAEHGGDLNLLGNYNSGARLITINRDALQSKGYGEAAFRGVLAHEIEHDAFRRVESDIFGPIGDYKDLRDQLSDTKEIVKLRRSAKFSRYADSYWKAAMRYRAGSFSRARMARRSINETLAEVSRMDALGKGDTVPANWRKVHTTVWEAYRTKTAS